MFLSSLNGKLLLKRGFTHELQMGCEYYDPDPPAPFIWYPDVTCECCRGTETEDALTRRLANAKAEMDFGTEPGNFEEVRGASDDLEGE